MIMFLRDIEIFELLGLSHFDDKQKDEYLNKMLRPILIQSVKRGVEESNLPEDKLDYLLELIDKNVDAQTLQIESLKLMPNLLKIIDEETYIFKKGALLDQLNDFQKNINNIPESEYFLSLIKNLNESLDPENEATFENNWKIFNSERSKFSK